VPGEALFPEPVMLHPEDHTAYLARHDFVIPPGDFTPPEKELLAKYGRWMEALASGALVPTTPNQKQFVRVARGESEPATDFERVWLKVLTERAVAKEVVRTFEALRTARAHASEVEAEYLAARQVVLASIREQLDEIDAEFAEQIQSANERSATAEKEVRELVLKLGRSVGIAGIKGFYRNGNVSWDNEKMAAYAKLHPEVLAFRKVGKPSSALRFGDGHTTSESGEAKADGERGASPRSE
jgi:uncharacterized protein YifE (UPF0438 family)